jgi:hypothetical protein
MPTYSSDRAKPTHPQTFSRSVLVFKSLEITMAANKVQQFQIQDKMGEIRDVCGI